MRGVTGGMYTGSQFMAHLKLHKSLLCIRISTSSGSSTYSSFEQILKLGVGNMRAESHSVRASRDDRADRAHGMWASEIKMLCQLVREFGCRRILEVEWQMGQAPSVYFEPSKNPVVNMLFQLIHFNIVMQKTVRYLRLWNE